MKLLQTRLNFELEETQPFKKPKQVRLDERRINWKDARAVVSGLVYCNLSPLVGENISLCNTDQYFFVFPSQSEKIFATVTRLKSQRGPHVVTPPSSNSVNNEHLKQYIGKQPPGPRMLDGTRGFSMGRGKPISVAIETSIS
ncbi:lupus La protein [Artemisia annua]|uniref:Lupus La protein n=1 Tax=Artemisia annua TaxID=35608 RepID=A0A2U1Q5F3_ARTAN|nr:lupus La protein [Artemisia annua]